MAGVDKEIDDMSSTEVKAELKFLVQAMAKNTAAVEKLTELSIRREERDSRQDEINKRQDEWNKNTTKTINVIFERIRTIEMCRAKEENGRHFVQKYYPFLMVACATGGAILTYWLPRLLS